ncbi:GNAT family N-acetyltransferase, partial [Planctomycetota bacterium]|nr:GNAT family N-acetyltransferase [Planctomycetota bacterium]
DLAMSCLAGDAKPRPKATTLRLVPWVETEGEALAAWVAADTWPFHGTANPTAEQVEGWIAKGVFTGDDNQTLWIQEGDERVGLLAFHEIDDATPIFDLRLRSAVRGRGFGKQALALVAEHAFAQLDKTRVEGHTRVDNLPMINVFQACGWTRESHTRECWPDAQGTLLDALTFGLLRREWSPA